MNSGVGIDVLDGRQQLVLRNIGGKQYAASLNANLLAALEGAALVGQVVLALAHTHDGQRRHDALFAQGGATSGKLLG